MVEIVCDILDYDNDKEIHYEDVKIFFIHFHMMNQSDKNEQNLYEIILNFFEGKQTGISFRLFNIIVANVPVAILLRTSL